MSKVKKESFYGKDNYLSEKDYIEWYREHYGKDPPAKLLNKYYPYVSEEVIDGEDWLT